LRIKFSQKWAKSERGARIRKILWMTVKAARATRKCKTLLVKVFFYTNENYKKCYSGNYRNIWHHGFYPKEWEMYAEKFDAIITLKLGKEVSDQEIAELFAHELGHHLQYLKSGRSGEKTADKIAKKILAKMKEKYGFPFYMT